MTRRQDKIFEREGVLSPQIGLGFVTDASIDPNTLGKFKKAKGIKGAEEPTGPELDGYFRSDEDDEPLVEDDLIIWVLYHNGYDISPAFCNRGGA